MSMQGMLDGFDAPAARSAEIARVIVDVDLAHMDRPLDYVVPDTLVDQAQVGSLVRVRFSGSRVDGWIVERTRREVDDHVGACRVGCVCHARVDPRTLRGIAPYCVAFLGHHLPGFLTRVASPARARGKRGIGVEAPRVAHDHRQVVGGGVACLPAGAAFLSRLRVGESPRAIVTALRLICARACRTPWPRPWPPDAPSSS